MKIGIKQIDEVPIDLSIRKKRFKEMEGESQYPGVSSQQHTLITDEKR